MASLCECSAGGRLWASLGWGYPELQGPKSPQYEDEDMLLNTFLYR